jgi:hypothetical protein
MKNKLQRSGIFRMTAKQISPLVEALISEGAMIYKRCRAYGAVKK